MKRYIRSADYNYSNIIGIGNIDANARKYLATMPDWVQDNVIKFNIRRIRSIVYTLVVEPLDSDPDPRPVIMHAHSISDIRNQISEYEQNYGGDRYTDTGYKALI